MALNDNKIVIRFDSYLDIDKVLSEVKRMFGNFEQHCIDNNTNKLHHSDFDSSVNTILTIDIGGN